MEIYLKRKQFLVDYLTYEVDTKKSYSFLAKYSRVVSSDCDDKYLACCEEIIKHELKV